jgi:selenide,water dikinase
LAQVLRHLASKVTPRALVGFSTGDDAAVYQLTPSMAVVETVDFFPPIVDDPYAFGEIAAANSLSDIWAMGAKPLFALNLVGFPSDLPISILSKILEGGQAKASEAGVPILGGHSVRDPEPKYGMAVTGLVHPKRVLTNAGAKVGDVLILTKPLGSGIATTALKQGVVPPSVIESAIKVMSALNQRAGELFASPKFKVHALTDITGFGLLGHLLGMMTASKRRAKLAWRQVPVIDGVLELATRGTIPGGTKSNLAYVKEKVEFDAALPEETKWVLADAQTNGGLLAAIVPAQAESALRALKRAGINAVRIGEVVRGDVGIEVNN